MAGDQSKPMFESCLKMLADGYREDKIKTGVSSVCVHICVCLYESAGECASVCDSETERDRQIQTDTDKSEIQEVNPPKTVAPP